MSDTPPPPPPGPGAPPPMAGGAGSQFGELASWGERAIAFLITGALVFAVYVAFFIVGIVLSAISDALGALWFLLTWLVSLGAAFYLYYLDGETGGHPGKRIMGLKTVDANTGQLIGGGKGIVRYLAHFVDSIVCYIGWLFPLWDQNRQTIGDKIVQTVVLKNQPKESFGPELFRP